MKAYDYQRCLSLLRIAQEDWHSQTRVTRRTWVQIAEHFPRKLRDRMLGQLNGYQGVYSDMKACAFITDLPAWAEAEKWAKAQLPPPPTMGGPRPPAPPSCDIGFGARKGIL